VSQLAPISKRFEIRRVLGAGGMGVVYEALDRERDVRVALKTLRSFTPNGLAQFKREFRALEGVHHRNLVHLGTLVSEGEQWFFTMELIEGVDFIRYVRPWHRELAESSGPVAVHTTRRTETIDAPLPLASALEVRSPTPVLEREEPTFDEPRLRASLLQLAQGLVALHEAKCVHCDIKPSNVLVTEDGRVVLVDFGIVGETEPGTPLERDSSAGTPAYMAPEQALFGAVAPAADWYSVGVVLYEALTGRIPFEGAAAFVLQEKQLCRPRLPSSFVRDLPGDLESLCVDLLAIEPDARPTGQEVLRRLGDAKSAQIALSHPPFSEPSPSLVGRAEELRALRGAFDLSADSARAVLIYGESGIGKTALLRELTLHLTRANDDVEVLAGRCHEREDVPYNALDEVIDQLSRRFARVSRDEIPRFSHADVSALTRVFPALRAIEALVFEDDTNPHAKSLEPRELRRRAFTALRGLLVHLAHRRRLVIAVDDLHWADADSLMLLEELLRPAGAAPVFFVATIRAHEDAGDDTAVSPALRSALPKDAQLLAVRRLAEAEAKELAAQSIAARGLRDDVLAAAIAVETGGHPRFIDEMARHSVAGERIELQLDDAVWGRAARLDSVARRLLEIVVVAGLPTPQRITADAAGLDPSALFAHVGSLRAAHLVRTDGAHGDESIEPYHDLVRESVMLHLGPETRRQHHKRLALAFERGGGADFERLAIHWSEAGDVSLSAQYAARAADEAAASLAFDRAARLYRLAVQLLPSEARPHEQKLADALFNAGRGGEAGHAYLALAGSGTDRDSLELRVRAARAFFGSGFLDDGVQAIRAVLAIAELPYPERRFSIVFYILWYRLLLRLSGLGFRSRDPATVPERDVLRSDVCTAAAFGIGMMDFARGALFQTLGARLALKLGDPSRGVRALCGLALSESAGGVKKADRAAEIMERARALGKDLTDPYLGALAQGADGFRKYFVEEWVASRACLAASEAALRNLQGVTYEIATVRMLLGRALVQLGLLTELDDFTGSFLRDSVRRNDVYSTANARATVCLTLALARDDVSGAAFEVAEATRILGSARFRLQHVYCLHAGCLLDLYRGAPDALLERLDAERAKIRASLSERARSVRVTDWSLRARAHLATAARDRGNRAAHLAVASRLAAKLERERLPASLALARLTQATAAFIRGQTDESARLLREAVVRFDEREMILHAASARHRLAAIVGGDEGRALDDDARVRFREQRIAAVEPFVATYAPGFSRA
jgi:serine/threonine protein kinase